MDLIKERLYYTIGEVGSILGLKASTIRYWEKHFPELKPSKRTGTSKRKFDQRDVQTLYKIKFILKVKKLSIKKAGSYISEWTDDIPFEEFRELVQEIRTPNIVFNKKKIDRAKNIVDSIRNLLPSIQK